MEVGCGTGYNLQRIARNYPHANLMGMDLSGDMLGIARQNIKPFGNRVELVQAPYGQTPITYQPEVILFSYALTMINPQWPEFLKEAYQDLPQGGFIVVTDFHDSKFPWFRSHMGNHHVRMDGHLLPVLRKQFTPVVEAVKNAYLGVWRYFLFIGQKTGSGKV